VVTATYNRSNVLRLAIESVRWQSVGDWELIVVGDACTDDTEDVVRSFEDGRIRFVNLPRNFGEQSGPNNEGLRLARGRHVAFLNHDDLWLRDHLETALRGLDETGADLVFTLAVHVGEDGPDALWGAVEGLEYQPWVTTPASSWVLPRATVDAVGPWRPATRLHTIPSQDWMYRAWRRGLTVRLVPRVTVVAIPSGVRRDAYARRDDAPQEEYFARIRDEAGFRERELTTLALLHASRQRAPRPLARYALRAAFDSLFRAAIALRLNPWAVYRVLVHRRRGGFLTELRHRRGLPPLR